jgi:hypothetical protein
VPGVDQQQLQAPLLKDLPDRLPVPAGGLYLHLDHALGGQPVGQRLQPRGEGLDVRTSWARPPRPSGARTHATTSSLATSNPAQRATSSSTVDTSPCRWVMPGRADRVNDAETRAHNNSSWCRDGPRVSLQPARTHHRRPAPWAPTVPSADGGPGRVGGGQAEEHVAGCEAPERRTGGLAVGRRSCLSTTSRDSSRLPMRCRLSC